MHDPKSWILRQQQVSRIFLVSASRQTELQWAADTKIGSFIASRPVIGEHIFNKEFLDLTKDYIHAKKNSAYFVFLEMKQHFFLLRLESPLLIVRLSSDLRGGWPHTCASLWTPDFAACKAKASSKIYEKYLLDFSNCFHEFIP